MAPFEFFAPSSLRMHGILLFFEFSDDDIDARLAPHSPLGRGDGDSGELNDRLHKGHRIPQP